MYLAVTLLWWQPASVPSARRSPGWHADERTVGSPLNDAELVALRRTRLFGATGTVLMAIGALGAGARPVVQDPTFGVRLLNLPSRIQTVSLTMTTTGAVMMALAWLMLGRFAAGQQPDVAQPAGPHAAAVGAAAADRPTDVQQGRLLLSGAERDLAAGPRPLPGRARHRARARPRLHAVGAQPVARNTRAVRTAVPVDRVAASRTVTGENIVEAVLFHRLVVLAGVGLIVWATPRLARRCGVAEVSALWLGPANPLLFMHLVAGIHNEALMLGLMLAGTEFALRGVDAASPLVPRPLAWPQGTRAVGALAADGHAAARHGADHVVVAGQAAVAAGARLRRDGAGLPMGRHVQGVRHRGRVADRGVRGGDGGDRLGQRPRLRLALHPRHRERRAQLDVAADAARARHRSGRHPARPRRPHHRGAGA